LNVTKFMADMAGYSAQHVPSRKALANKSCMELGPGSHALCATDDDVGYRTWRLEEAEATSVYGVMETKSVRRRGT
jgi:hypothetical protein